MRYVNVISAIAAMVICACAPAPAVQAADVGTLTYVEGRVDVLRPGSEKWTPASNGTSISAGDAIRTKSNAKAEATFNDKTVMRIAQNSRIDIKDYQLDANNNRKAANIMIERGKARTIIAKMKDAAEFRLCTPNSCGTVKGSDIFTYYQSGSSGILVVEGALSVFNPVHPDVVLKVPAGNAAVVPFEDAPKGPRKYLEMEQKVHEQDTSIPETIVTRKGASVIRGTIAKFTGDVKVTTRGSDAAHAASRGEIVNEGDKIVTGPNGIVEITLDNGNAIYLKQNTVLTILKLVIDAKTGEFENLFGTEKGDVKARIEGLRGKSKFEVKTPTALCGARGTIMLIHVALDGATNSFFEGGNGYTTNLGSGETLDINAGSGASTNEGGSVTQTEAPAGDDRAGMDDGFDPDGGKGDSSEGTGGGDLADGGLGGGRTNRISDAVDKAAAGTGDTIDAGDVVDVPITDVISEEEQEEDANEVIHGTQTGNFFYSDPSGATPVLMDAGGLYDIAMACDFGLLWDSTVLTKTPFTLTANYDLSTSYEFLVWTAEGFHESYDETTLKNATSSGGAYHNIAGAIRGSGRIEGLMAGVYIDDLGNAGTILGSFEGPDREAFSVSGDAYVHQLKSGFDLLPEDLVANIDDDSNLYGKGSRTFSGGSNFVVDVPDGVVLNIESPKGMGWGIWGIRMAGSYVKPGTDYPWPLSWKMEIAGRSLDSANGIVDSAWLQVMSTDSAWQSNRTTSTFDGIWITVHHDGTMTGGSMLGKGVGNYVDVAENMTGGWEGVACGEWVEAALPLDTTDITTLTSSINSLNPTPVPITIAENIPTMTGSLGNITNVTMDMRCYESVVAANNGVWAAVISGAYSADPGIGAMVTAVNGANNATLTVTDWSGGYWRADVSGTTAGNRDLDGNAAGQYAAGSFSGTGAGTWETSSGGT